MLAVVTLTLRSAPASAQPRRNPGAATGQAVQHIKCREGQHPATFAVPELIGRYVDDFGAVRLELFANGTGTLAYRNGATQHIRWGLRLDRADDPTARYFSYDAEGRLTYELLIEHLEGDKAFEYERAEYVPSFRGRKGTPYLVVERPTRVIWALQKEK
jgi:hypothetical protein